MGWLLLAVVAVGVVMAWRSDAVRRYSMSATAVARGIDNTPTDPNVIQRLEWLATQEPLITDVLREVEPLAIVSSGYRCPALNAAIGGVATSDHLYGLALDFSPVGDPLAAVQYLQANADRLPATLSQVIAEPNEVHCGWHDPLGIVQRSPGCQWLQKLDDGSYMEV